MADDVLKIKTPQYTLKISYRIPTLTLLVY